jgi:spore coat protein U-like protein
MARSPWIALLLLGSAEPAFASGCTITGNAPTVTATATAFNAYSAAALSDNQANGTVQIKCPLGIGLLPSFTIALSAGNGGSGFAPRAMQSGANRLGYNIYTTSGYGTVWGDGNDGTVTQTYFSPLSLGTISFTAYGAVPTGQFVATGSYSDTITVTVTY